MTKEELILKAIDTEVEAEELANKANEQIRAFVAQTEAAINQLRGKAAAYRELAATLIPADPARAAGE